VEGRGFIPAVNATPKGASAPEASPCCFNHRQRYKTVARALPMADNGVSQPGSKTVKIEIYDQSYNVNADGNEEYLKELAAYVDGKMRSVADATKMVDSLKVAVLAALNIADEMFTLRQRQDAIEGPLRKRVEKCVALVEKALEHSN
jgi:cell division protein ZapA